MAATMPTMIQSQLRLVLHPSNTERVKQDELTVFDKGLFLAELRRQGIVFSSTAGRPNGLGGSLQAKCGLSTGTYKGTKMAGLELYKLFEETMAAEYDTKGLESSYPVKRTLEEKQKLYQWSDPKQDFYPPHLLANKPLPGGDKIFDATKRNDVAGIATAMELIMPTTIQHLGTPYYGPTLADTEAYNRDPSHKAPATDIMAGRNIGELADWYSDRRFAQQQLSGVNPCTITKASPERIKEFAAEAGKQGLAKMADLIKQNKDIYMQDYSFFRPALELPDDQTFSNKFPVLDDKGQPTFFSRYASAPIGLFQLHEDGALHPLAITIDYKGSMDKSATIFNQRLAPKDKAKVAEKDDWPWRYAKTVLQVADWGCHEIGVHLVDTHLIEEAIIVSTHRTVPDEHPIYELLSPHWFRTLALNQGARSLLVPAVIDRIAGFGPAWRPSVDKDLKPLPPHDSNSYKLIRHLFKTFDFQGKYIPKDLKTRGFDVENDGESCKLRNYPYATNMYLLWQVLRQFVKKALSIKYTTDESVQADDVIKNWCKEIQEKGTVTSFPTITTLDQLIDACTMCIHIASPQHTAINYLQNYYYSYVPSKPPALCTPLPSTLKDLQAITEKDLTAALPIGPAEGRWKDWLLAAQLPELLSFQVEEKYNLLTYAHTLYKFNCKRTSEENEAFGSDTLMEAGAELYGRLIALQAIFDANSAFQAPGSVEYKVMSPQTTAVSILL